MTNRNSKFIVKNFFVYILTIFLIVNFLLLPIAKAEESGGDINVLELNEKIKDGKKQIRELTEQMEKYKKEIASRQAKSTSLANQLSILDNRIAKAKLDIQTTQARLTTINLELEKLELQIKAKEEEIENQKKQLVGLIKMINKLDQKNYLEILVLNDSFSDFFNQLQFVSQLQDGLKDSVDQLKKNREDLAVEQAGLAIKQKELNNLQITLTEQKNALEENKTAKEGLLEETKASEQHFSALVTQLKQEQLQTESEINRMERTVREKLLGKKDAGLPGVVSLMWPINPERGITAYFHDPDYPFRYIFEHPAIDIRAGQGTEIRAAESGYVARAKMPVSTAYSYIMLIHGNQLSTVYGHTSKIYVKEDDYVVKGQALGATGGLPGTPGAGGLTTGPHLHFEVRKNGIPVNPLEYLP